jgi:hypothetical protein
MSRSLGREFAEELIGKAVVWTPLTAGMLLLGPAGMAAVGVATAVAIACSGSSGDGSTTETGAARNEEV